MCIDGLVCIRLSMVLIWKIYQSPSCCQIIVFMVGVGANDHSPICYMLGATLHYLWLSVFSFKTIAIVFLTHNLMKMSANNSHMHSSKTVTKIWLTVLGFALPILFVAPSLLMDIIPVPELRPQYNGQVCFPTGYPANLAFVSVPWGLSMLANIGCFITIGVFVSKISHETRHVRKSTKYQYIFVFSRITVVSGMFWILGIVAGLVESPIAEFVFIVFCSFNGLFIAIANLTTKNVHRAWRTSGTKKEEIMYKNRNRVIKATVTSF